VADDAGEADDEIGDGVAGDRDPDAAVGGRDLAGAGQGSHAGG
jgi:hypothetical protein